MRVTRDWWTSVRLCSAVRAKLKVSLFSDLHVAQRTPRIRPRVRVTSSAAAVPLLAAAVSRTYIVLSRMYMGPKRVQKKCHSGRNNPRYTFVWHVELRSYFARNRCTVTVNGKCRYSPLGFVVPAIADFRSTYRKMAVNSPTYLFLEFFN